MIFYSCALVVACLVIWAYVKLWPVLMDEDG